MAEIYLHNQQVHSIFQLLGDKENDISYSVAWALAKAPSFLNEFLYDIIGSSVVADGISIRLQQHEHDGGITDIEIELPNQFYLIVEAKRGWNLPGRRQLEKYAKRYPFSSSEASLKHLIVISECNREYANLHLESQDICGVRVIPISWKDMALFAKKAQSKGSYAEKRLIQELLIYLRGLMTMQNINSNWVYVVSLAKGTPHSWKISWIDIVKKRSLYFHPVGGGRGGWPKEPPNYIAFRYDGKLQSIHHIENYEVLTNMHKRIPELPNEQWEPHFLYTLGPAIIPIKEIKTGKIYPNGRVWCMLDTLFTCQTISEARDISRKRQEK